MRNCDTLHITALQSITFKKDCDEFANISVNKVVIASTIAYLCRRIGTMKKEHEKLYNVWSKFSCRTPEQQEILKIAGKKNCSVLTHCGKVAKIIADRQWYGSSRYCLKPEYVIPDGEYATCSVCGGVIVASDAACKVCACAAQIQAAQIQELEILENDIGRKYVKSPEGYSLSLDTVLPYSQFRGYLRKDGSVEWSLGVIRSWGEWPAKVLWVKS